MILNHIEILTAKWLSYDGYLTENRVPFYLPKEKTGKQSQWSDVDILAVRGNEVKFVECKSFLGTKSKEVIATEIQNHFRLASEYILDTVYPWLKARRAGFLVVAEAPHNLQSYRDLLGENIELKHFREVIEAILVHLRTKSPPDKYKGAIAYGIKEEENMCRLLLTLLAYGLLK